MWVQAVVGMARCGRLKSYCKELRLAIRPTHAFGARAGLVVQGKAVFG